VQSVPPVMSNLSEIRVSIKFMPKLHIFSFKAEHRVALRGIYHVYGYKFRPAWKATTTYG
jgi:hypothetical protein